MTQAPAVASRSPAPLHDDPAPLHDDPAPLRADPAPLRADPAPMPRSRGALPRARNLLAVVARPGQESVELGGLLYAYRRSGARLALLCLTRGEASPLNSSLERLETLRPWELQVAAGLLGVSSIAVVDYPDGGLSACRAGELTERVGREVRRQAPDVLLVIDSFGSPDDVAVAAATLRAGLRAGLPVLARCMPGARGGWLADLGPQAARARAAQRSAAAAHASQSDALAGVQRRLSLLDGRERLRWLALAHRWSGDGQG
jgi:LmbE family N-acetylglucosaminyl deacetylase